MDFDTFLYLRHGQSEANLRGLMCGRRCDSPLTDLGREQARLAATILRRTCLVGSICVSPQDRAQETARIANAVLSVPVITIDEFAEWDVGSWDHQPFVSVREEFLSKADPPGGETRSALVLRVQAALKRCADMKQPALLLVMVASGWRFSRSSVWNHVGQRTQSRISCNEKRISGT